MSELPGNQDTPPGNGSMRQDLRRLWSWYKEFFFNLINLTDGLDREGTIVNIKNNKRMQGANAWLLMCSIMIASLGLDLNSQAVIIGAMLISPLMSPILGIGLAVGTNDRNTLIISLGHFGIAIAIALITSTIYFFFTPFGNITEEISRRTEPTFLDVLVAFFGGVAGIISGSRKDKSNAIPGVAIATALMPPLCVTGFGLAKWLEQLFGIPSDPSFTAGEVILNSFYLFFLNSFFVAIATLFIVRLLKFPFKRYLNRTARFKAVFFMTLFSLITVIPSFLILQRVMKKVRTERNKDLFINDYLADKIKYLDDSKLIQTDEGNKLILKVYGSEISQQDSNYYRQGLEKYHLTNTTLEIIPTSDINFETFSQLQARVSNYGTILDKRLEASRKIQDEKDLEILLLKDQIDSLSLHQSSRIELFRGLQVIIDDMQAIGYSPAMLNEDGSLKPTIFVKWKKNKSTAVRKKDEAKIVEFCRLQMNIDSVEVISN